MLNEMLDNLKPSERLVEGDAFDQIAQRCRNVQPKIQKWIGSAEEGEDADSIGKTRQYKAWQRTLTAGSCRQASFDE
jgi:hypothetical protein